VSGTAKNGSIHEERRTEVLARRIAEARFGVHLTVADHNTGYSVHDYDFCFQGVPGALEVVVAANQPDVNRSIAHNRYASEGFETQLLNRSWLVSVGDSVYFKNLEAKVEPFLVELEQRGIARLAIEDCYRQPQRDLLDAARQLDLHMAQAFGSEADTAARIWITTHYGGVAGNPNDAAKEFEALLWSTDDVRHKLAASDRAIREAFVVAHLSSFSLWRPLEEGLPITRICLPPEITAAWLVRGDGQGWRFEEPSGWEELDSIAGIFESLPDR
jgi:hypothetical protein